MQNPADTYAHHLPNAQAEERTAIDALAAAVGAAIRVGDVLPPAASRDA